jgi:hypothetical protein
MWEETLLALFKILSRHFWGGNIEDLEKCVCIVGPETEM